MKKSVSLPLFALLLAACVRPAPTLLPPDAAMTEAGIPQPTAIIALPSNTPIPTPLSTDTPAPTEIPEDTATPEPTEEPQETNTPEDSPTPELDEFGNTVTPVPSATIQTGPFDPAEEYGIHQYNELFLSNGNWITNSGELPDTSNIQLEIIDHQMYVTGKNPEFDTWWFTWLSLTDFYIEMTVNTGECAGKDAYGLILRGAPSGQPARGYIVMFSCDGAALIRRLDTTNPYSAEQLLGWTENPNINSGANAANKLGVLAEGDTITIFANGFNIATITDAKYTAGRYGVFVNAGQSFIYTYSIQQIRAWRLD